jgi:hypothetical protein
MVSRIGGPMAASVAAVMFFFFFFVFFQLGRGLLCAETFLM